MTTPPPVPCTELERFKRIHAAFVTGDLGALRDAVEDQDLVPNGNLGDLFGTCLVYAIDHSPLSFVRELLELGADPRAPVDDGFPPLIAALATGREELGVARRDDMHDLLRLLLAFGADPAQRGINDYTALHMAVGEDDAEAIQILLQAGADPDLRTRIDDHDTALEMAESMARHGVAAVLTHWRNPASPRHDRRAGRGRRR